MMQKRINIKILIVCLLFFAICFFAACASDNQAINLDEIANNDTDISDGGSYYPDGDGSTNVCEEDEEGNCIDEADISSIMLANQQIDFGISEVDSIECQSLGLPSGITYEAEIDRSFTSQVDGEYQFAVLNASGGYSDGRVSGSGDITICYLHTAIGTHAGQVKIIINAASESATYAYVIKVQGQTLASLFTITSPTEGQIVDSRSGHNEGEDTAEGDYLITVSGQVNMDLLSIFEQGSTTPIYIKADDVKYKATFDSSGKFSKQIGVPQVEGVYDITFSMNTNKGDTLSKTVTIVVAGSPKLEIEVRDSSGTEVDTSQPTDLPYLVVGLKVSNLQASGSSESNMPVTLYDIQFNGQELFADTEIWYEEEWSWCVNEEEGENYKGFDETRTYCIPLDYITELQDGINVITAKAKNDLGETSASHTVIIDNDKPIIEITNPTQNELFSPGKTTIQVAGKVKYFAPVDAALLSQVPEAKSGDVGSYCQPTSDEDSSCPASSVKMWFNISTSDDNYPIYIYPEYNGSYSSVTSEEEDEYMDSESDGQGNCYEVTTSTDDEEDTTRTVCDVPEANFKLTLTVPSDDHHAFLHLYTNAVEFQAESVKGHRTIEIVTFQVGETSSHAVGYEVDGGSNSYTLTAGQLGNIQNSCGNTDTGWEICVDRAPVMMNVSEGLISRDSVEGQKILKVVEHYLNENISFADIANGWMYWPKDENDNIDIEADFQQEYLEATGSHYDDFQNLSMEWRKKFIQRGLHSNIMVTKYWALWRYRQVLYEQKDSDCADNVDLCFFKREGDPESEYNVALDACEEPITTAFVPIGDLKYLYDAMGVEREELLNNDDWPIFADSVDYDDFVSGKWIVHSLDLKDKGYNEKGYIDADVCLVPNDPELEDEYAEKGCDADVSSASVPAFWGHFVSYNMVEKGLLGEQFLSLLGIDFEYSINDDTIPLFWSIGKIRLKLEDLIRVTQEDVGGSWTNKVEIIGENIKDYDQDIVSENRLSELFDSSKMHAKSIQIESFHNCMSYFESQHPGYFKPFGCDEDPEWNYPFILDLNSVQGQTIYSDLTAEGTNTAFLGVIWWGVMDTFRKMVSCMDTEMINPMISSQFEYPEWVWEGGQMSMDFEWEDFNFGANIENMGLNVEDGGITVRVPLSVGVDGVPSSNVRTDSNASGDNLANIKGHLKRKSSSTGLDTYPFVSATPQDSAFLGASINLEEIVNAAAYLIFKKGPMSLLETFEIEEVEKNDNWSVGVDKVVLGRFDICDIAGLIPSELPPSLLFATIQSMFNESTLHLDLILDPDYPITLSLNEIEGLNSSTATEVQLGITNLQLGVKELKAHEENGETVANVYDDPKDQEEIVRIRLDGVIKLQLVYHQNVRQIYVYIPGYADQNIHASVPSGHGGVSYDDVNVVTDVLNGVVKAVFDKMMKDISEDIEEDDDGNSNLSTVDANPTLIITLKGDDEYGQGTLSAADVMDFEFELNVDAAENASCGDDVPYYYGEEGTMANEEGNDDDETSGSGTTQTAASKNVSNLSLVKAEPQLMDMCEMLYGRPTFDEDGKFAKEEDPIRDALCDFGIKDVVLTPTIEFDNDEGYIHVSADLFIELENWLLD